MLHGQLLAIGSDDPFVVLQLVFGLLHEVFGAMELRNLEFEVLQNLTYDDDGNGSEAKKWFVVHQLRFQSFNGDTNGLGGLKESIVEISEKVRNWYITTESTLQDSSHQISSIQFSPHTNNKHLTRKSNLLKKPCISQPSPSSLS